MFNKIATLLMALAPEEEGFSSSTAQSTSAVIVVGSGSDLSYGPIFSLLHCLTSLWNIPKKME
jgi:hypothetical protein